MEDDSVVDSHASKLPKIHQLMTTQDNNNNSLLCSPTSQSVSVQLSKQTKTLLTLLLLFLLLVLQTSPQQQHLRTIRQRSSDLNLPLITALFNDADLMRSLEQSQSMQQIAPEAGANVTTSTPNKTTTSASGGSALRPTSWHVTDSSLREIIS